MAFKAGDGEVCASAALRAGAGRAARSDAEHALTRMKQMPTGTWLEETAAPYYVFTGAGHTVEIVSIAGGEIPVDEVGRPG